MSNAKKPFMKGINLFDLLVIALITGAVLAFYFSVINPKPFSGSIKREGVNRYVQVKLVLPEDLEWLSEVLDPQAKRTDVYDRLEWQLEGFEEKVIAGKKRYLVNAKILCVEKSTGLLRYGKYTIVQGGRVFLINDEILIEGRIWQYEVTDEVIKA